MSSVLGAAPAVRQAQYEEQEEPVAVATTTVVREPDLPSFKSEDDDDALSYFARLADED